jgi:hypothetical protein
MRGLLTIQNEILCARCLLLDKAVWAKKNLSATVVLATTKIRVNASRRFVRGILGLRDGIVH